jgi:hypothetical protein
MLVEPPWAWPYRFGPAPRHCPRSASRPFPHQFARSPGRYLRALAFARLSRYRAGDAREGADRHDGGGGRRAETPGRGDAGWGDEPVHLRVRRGHGAGVHLLGQRALRVPASALGAAPRLVRHPHRGARAVNSCKSTAGSAMSTFMSWNSETLTLWGTK